MSLHTKCVYQLCVLVVLVGPQLETAAQSLSLWRTPSWYRHTFRWFDKLKDPELESYKYGFPPGMYGSSVMPMTMWYHLWCRDRPAQMFMQRHNMRMFTLDYNHLIRQCDENKNPRCSWVYFLALLSPKYFCQEFLSVFMPDVDDYYKNLCYPVPIMKGDCYPFYSVDQMSVIYIYQVCHMFRPEDVPNLNLKSLCPNPCGKAPCREIDYAITGSCHPVGYHSNDFICKCTVGYQWENTTKMCAMEDSCKETCHPDNTLHCQLNETTGSVTCKCKDIFMGFDCSQLLDSCVVSKAPDSHGLDVGAYIPAGSTACGSDLDSNNLCKHIVNTTSFSCSCGSGYSRDMSLPFDNCLHPADSCDSQICVYGQCVSSPDLSQSACDCEQGYTGPLCDQPLGTWSQWSSWTACDPICGPVRHRRRLRSCLSDEDTICLGRIEEVRQCDKDTECLYDVSVEEETWIRFMQWITRAMKLTLMYIGTLGITLNLIGLCKPHGRPSLGHRVFSRLSRMSRVGVLANRMSTWMRQSRMGSMMNRRQAQRR